MDFQKTNQFLDEYFPKFVDGLSEFIKVPNLTPKVTETFLTDGLIQEAFATVHKFVESLDIKNLTYEDFDRSGTAPPMRVYTVGGHKVENVKSAQHVMLYGHLDKQPWGPDWTSSPTEPVIKGNKLYGRGSSDDGYSPYAAFLAIKNLQDQDVAHPKFTLLFESEEESGSSHILGLMEDAKEAIGVPDLIFILDSGTLDYKTLWVTATMRGIVNVDVNVEVLKGGIHSGVGSGMVPEPHRIMRMLLDRVEDTQTGMVKLPEVSSPVPDSYKEFASQMVNDIGDGLWKDLPLVDGCQVINQGDNLELYLRNTWHAGMTVIGFAGLPETKSAGNALNPKISFRLSFRISPDRNPVEAAAAIKRALEENPPYGCKVLADPNHQGFGYKQKDLPAGLSGLLDEVSQKFYGDKAKYYGLGATIPLLTDLAKKFPEAYIIATGVLGNDCNAHGPNESIELPYTKKFIGVMSHILGTM